MKNRPWREIGEKLVESSQEVLTSTAMKRIALVFPPTRALTVMPPIGLGILAAILRRRGFEPEIVDLAARRWNLFALRQQWQENPPAAVGISIMTSNYCGAQTVAAMVRGLPRRPLLLLGGPHVSARPAESLQELGADFAFVREAEEALPALLDDLEAGRKPSRRPGVVFFRDGVLEDGGPAPYLADLDAVPWPAWDLLRPENYPPTPHQLLVKRLPAAPVLSSRGCPCACRFCTTTWMFGPRLRRRRVDDVVDEMKYLADRHRIAEFHVEDDNPTIVREHFVNFCQALLGSGRTWIWKLPNGVMTKTLDEALVSLMARAGCYQINLGIESLSDAPDRDKEIDVARVREIARWCRAQGVQLQGLFILGLPNEDQAAMAQTVRRSRRAGLDLAHFAAFTPLPGSVWGNAHATADAVNLSYFSAGLDPHVKRMQRRAVWRFYCRPRPFWTALKMIKVRQLAAAGKTVRRYLFG